MTSPDTVLVIPTFRDGAQLAEFLPRLCAEFSSGVGRVKVQVVDDGSPLEEQRLLGAHIDQIRATYSFLQPLLAQPINGGKGSAIRAGWIAAGPMTWLAFVDADGAAPAREVADLLRRAWEPKQTPALFIAVRTDQTDKAVRRFWYRRIGSRLFNAWVRGCLGLSFSDTQCGLKIVPGAWANPMTWQENGFAFDLELLLRARAVGLPIFTQPIAWSERAGSSLGPGAMLGLFVAAFRLRKLRTPISSDRLKPE